ncbi:hypothetical protein Q4577_22865 [Marinovum sp. 2_MG-2023]|uniref:hypothetical protein n=1 Tax=unclassified Marinovum TaxID=2647166 RepID=UPI0026E43FC8|nr:MULTISPECIES: hypothetical protein [unclassified Marinovum]MDO6732860.1 hypothetical protein [Marinovum sp. 2_MG-2023]MDO6782138.1 hypothetical protein [Marinovum sp. 1_MG-2023]
MDEENTRDSALGLVRSRGQARRIQKIEARRLEGQRRLDFVGLPSAFDLCPGAVFTSDFLGLEQMDGVCRVTEADSALMLKEPGKCAMRVALSAVEERSTYYSWVATDEVGVLFDITGTPASGEITFAGVAPYTRAIAGVRIYQAAEGAGFGAASAIGSVEAIES